MIISFINNPRANGATNYLAPRAKGSQSHEPSRPQAIVGHKDWFAGAEALTGAPGHSKRCVHYLSLEAGFAVPLDAKAARRIARALLKLLPEPCVKAIVPVHHRPASCHCHLIRAKREVSHRPNPRNSKRRAKP